MDEMGDMIGRFVVALCNGSRRSDSRRGMNYVVVSKKINGVRYGVKATGAKVNWTEYLS